ncbi:MAG: DUF4194 domain-containing protein [Endozoicomonas sp.]|uniref:DUF4194 domain-containing protein n=1 Tax=Endozoicomonas sp. TaxID=1892382 RepID=UPI003D9B089B
MTNIFDQITATKTIEPTPEAPEPNSKTVEDPSADHKTTGQYTAKDIKITTQELLKFGILEAERKPNLYKKAVTYQTAINQVLEPLDLKLKVDDIRGLVFLVVSEQTFFEESESDDWSHPLIRRQRLNLEQSLLIAILRQWYVAHEQEVGIGASEAIVYLEDLLPQLQLYLGDTGSDAREQKRLRNLLENLRGHGIVSEVNDKDQFIIRPVITHLANPESLQGLLQHFQSLTESSTGRRQ